MIPLNGVIAKKSRDYQKKLMVEKDHRIKLMHEVRAAAALLYACFAWWSPWPTSSLTCRCLRWPLPDPQWHQGFEALRVGTTLCQLHH
jgi:hypothetical protein